MLVEQLKKSQIMRKTRDDQVIQGRRLRRYEIVPGKISGVEKIPGLGQGKISNDDNIVKESNGRV